VMVPLLTSAHPGVKLLGTTPMIVDSRTADRIVSLSPGSRR
jgi:hypothetical protein